jgi:aryl-alcohol dehydrogenase-like predicted oxidoreductase
MHYRTLGRTGLKVSAIGFGGWAAGGAVRLGVEPAGYADVSEEDALSAIIRAFDLGVTLFDTADIYGLGRGERLFAQALKAHRHEVVLVTKGGAVPEHGGFVGDFSKAHLMAACERSLRRLATGHIDVYLLHAFAAEERRVAQFREAFEALDVLKRQGKIRFGGVSVDDPLDGEECMIQRRADVVEVLFNAMYQKPKQGMFAVAQGLEVGVIARAPLMYGLLTGKYGADARFGEDDWRRSWSAKGLERLAGRARQFGAIATAGRTTAQAALQFVLAHDAVHAAIPGARTAAQVEENVRAVDAPPPAPEEIHAIENLWGTWNIEDRMEPVS